jgi:putative lipoic acid-binding regulatory protein
VTGSVSNACDDVFHFPCPFPLKVIGRAGELFIPTMINILEGVIGPVAKESVSSRLSRDGKYISLTVTFTAHSREQLEAIYAAVRKNPDVVMVL